MKRYSLLLLVLVAVVFAVSCRDTTSPAGSRALLSPRNPELVVIGNKPPPPVDAAIAVTVNSPGQAVFTGVFFNNGKLSPEGDPIETFDGTAWLRFDNMQPDLGGTASPNARFMVKGDDRNCPLDPSTCPTGQGTLTIEGVVYTIASVQSFRRVATCGTGGEPCATIHFTLACQGDLITDCNGTREHGADIFAFDRSSCLVDKNNFSYYVCGFPPPEVE
jgi:hypothetical protein